MAQVRNVVYRVEDQRLIVEIPLDGDFGESKSGLSRLVASAVGMVVKGGGGLRLNVLAYRPYRREELRAMASAAKMLDQGAGE